MQSTPTATPSEISELARCCAVFVPGDPARTGRVAFWQPDVSPPPLLAAGSAEDLTVVLPGGDGVECVGVLVLLPVRAALPVLTRARTDLHGHRESVFWGAAGVLALQFVARGLLPGLSAQDHNAWRVVPLPLEDIERVRRLAAAMPPEAHAVPRDGAGPQAQAHAVAADAAGPPRLADPERLLCASPDRNLTARAVIGPSDGEPGTGRGTSDAPSFLSADALLAFNWRFARGDEQFTCEEPDRLAEANRPSCACATSGSSSTPRRCTAPAPSRTARSRPSTRSVPR